MRIFITGASGFVGTAVVREFISAGHNVVGLARSDSAAKVIADTGAVVYRGDLERAESLERGASEADAIIHTGFNHDFSKFKASCENDRKVIDALGSALAHSKRPLIVTSAIGVLPPGSVATEQTMPLSPCPNPRAATEEAVRALIDRGGNVSVVRLPPSTHGEGDHGFVPMLIKIARDKGASAYIGEGLNRWPAVHRFDAAKVYRLAVERATRGAYYHAVAEEGVPFRQIAEVIGRCLKVPVVSKSQDEAAAHFTWFAYFAAMNVTASSKQTPAGDQIEHTFVERLVPVEARALGRSLPLAAEAGLRLHPCHGEALRPSLRQPSPKPELQLPRPRRRARSSGTAWAPFPMESGSSSIDHGWSPQCD